MIEIFFVIALVPGAAFLIHRSMMRRIIMYLNDGNNDDAMKLVNRTIRLFPYSKIPRYIRIDLKATYYFDYLGLLVDCTDALKRNENDEIIYINRGYAYSKLNKIDEALRDYDKALELQPDLSYALLNRSDLRYNKLNDVAGAIADCETLIEYQPLNFYAYSQMINIYVDLNDLDSAFRVTQKAKLMSLHPSYYHILRAYVLAIRDGYEHAKEDLKLAPQTGEDLFVSLIRGRILNIGQEYQNEVYAYSKALQSTPYDIRLYLARASAYQRLGEHDKSMQDYDRALQLNPHYTLIYNNRAYHLAYLGQVAKALEDVNRFIQHDPYYKYGYGTRGAIYFVMENYPAALADFEKALALKNNDDYSMVCLGATYYQMGDMEKAKRYWQQALEQTKEYRDVEEFMRDYYPPEPLMDVIRKVSKLLSSPT